MKVEFNGNSYNIGNRATRIACSGCIIAQGSNLKCPNSKGECILPLDKIYINLCSNQVFEL